MDSKKRITIISCTLFIMLGFLVNGVSMLFENRDSVPDSNLQDSHVSSFNVETEQNYSKNDDALQKYVLKIQDGIVVVFESENTNRPLFVTDIYAGTLRNYDRELLSQGLVANGIQELQSIIEDFSS